MHSLIFPSVETDTVRLELDTMAAIKLESWLFNLTEDLATAAAFVTRSVVCTVSLRGRFVPRSPLLLTVLAAVRRLLVTDEAVEDAGTLVAVRFVSQPGGDCAARPDAQAGAGEQSMAGWAADVGRCRVAAASPRTRRLPSPQELPLAG